MQSLTSIPVAVVSTVGRGHWSIPQGRTSAQEGRGCRRDGWASYRVRRARIARRCVRLIRNNLAQFAKVFVCSSATGARCSGLVIPVSAANTLLELVESRHPGTVRESVPAHVSLLYPFVGVAELDERVTHALSELVAEHEPMPVEFAECYRRGGFVALRPDPIDGLTELTRKTHDRWPDVVPYEGSTGMSSPT